MVRLFCWYGVVVVATLIVWQAPPPNVNSGDGSDARKLSLLSVGVTAFDRAYQALSSNKLLEAEDLFKRSAKEGHSKAMYELALMSVRDKAVSPERGRDWARKAADAGHLDGMYLYAAMALSGLGGEQSPREAVTYYKIAAAKGHAPSIANLAWMYHNGFGITTDFQQGILHAHRATETQNNSAQFFMSLIHATGHGVDKDLGMAQEWADAAAANGNTDAQLFRALLTIGTRQSQKLDQVALEWLEASARNENMAAIETLARIHLHGVGMDQDVAKALHWYEQAALVGHPPALLALGEIYEMGILDPQKRPDYAKAYAYYERAANRGSAEGMTLLGKLQLSGMGDLDQRDFRDAMKSFRDAERAGSASAVTQIAIMHLEGNGVKKDPHRAMECFQRAAEGGDHDAEVYIGHAYQTGDMGLEVDYEAAAEWYTKAADSGHAAAQSKLGRMYQQGIGVAKDITRGMELARDAARTELRRINFLPPSEEAGDLRAMFVANYAWSPLASNIRTSELTNSIPRIKVEFVKAEPFSIAPTVPEVVSKAMAAAELHMAAGAPSGAGPSSRTQESTQPSHATGTPTRAVAVSPEKLGILRQLSKELGLDLESPPSPGVPTQTVIGLPATRPKIARGTGWVTENGLIATAFHVVSGRREIIAMIQGKERNMELVFSDAKENLALLKPTGRFSLPPAFWMSGARLSKRDRFFALGVSGEGEEITPGFIQTAVAEPRVVGHTQFCGMIGELPSSYDGAPIVGDDGQVIGMVVGKHVAPLPPEATGPLASRYSFGLRIAHVQLAFREIEIDRRVARVMLYANSPDQMMIQLRDSIVQIVAE